MFVSVCAGCLSVCLGVDTWVGGVCKYVRYGYVFVSVEVYKYISMRVYVS